MLSSHACYLCVRDVDIMIENIILVINDLRRDCRNRDLGGKFMGSGKSKVENRKLKANTYRNSLRLPNITLRLDLPCIYCQEFP
jgi:hypothetical protein